MLASYLINWGCNPYLEWLVWFIKKSKYFNQSAITSDTAALTLTLSVNGPLKANFSVRHIQNQCLNYMLFTGRLVNGNYTAVLIFSTICFPGYSIWWNCTIPKFRKCLSAHSLRCHWGKTQCQCDFVRLLMVKGFIKHVLLCLFSNIFFHLLNQVYTKQGYLVISSAQKWTFN